MTKPCIHCLFVFICFLPALMAQDEAKKSDESEWIDKQVIPKVGKKIHGEMIEYSLDDFGIPLYVYQQQKDKLLVRGLDGIGWISAKDVVLLADATKLYEQYVADNPKNATAWAELARIRALANNEYLQAIEDCTKALELDEKLVMALKVRGNCHYRTRDHESALADYDKAIEIDPKFAPAYNNKANIYNVKGEKEKAIEFYKKALAVDEKGIYYRNIGTVYMNQGEIDNAEKYFLKAIKFNEHDPHSHYALAYLYMEMKGDSQEDLEKAIKLLSKACQLMNWKNKRYMQALVNAYQRNGDDEMAAELQEKIDQLAEENQRDDDDD